jgi:HSP20 family molecular chaperone IbpA
VYHAAGIRQGLFRVELPLPAPVDPERVEARYDRGLLQVTLAKAA